MRPVRRRVLLLVAFAFFASCPKAPPKQKDRGPPPDPRGEIRELVKQVYSAIEAGDSEAVAPFLASDVMAFGLAPSDTFADSAAVLKMLQHELMPVGLGRDVVRIRTRRIDVGVAADHASAWFWDLPRVELERKGVTSVWLPRVTGHVVYVKGRWRIDAVHVSLPVPDEEAFRADATTKFVPPAEVIAERGKDSDELVGLSRRILDDVQVKVDRTSDRAEVVLLGTGPAEVFEGGKAFKDLVRPRLSEIKKSVFSYKVVSPVRSRLSPGRRSGWVAANVVLKLGAGKKQQTLPPFRVLWVFAEEKGLWNLVIEQQSLALWHELRTAATAAEQTQFDALDGVRKKRADGKLGQAESAAEPVAAPPPPQPEPTQPGKGRVTPALDGGIGTFE